MRAPRWPLSKVASPCPGRSKGPKRRGQDRTRHRPSFCPGEEGRCRPAPLWCLQAYLKWAAEGGKDRQLPGLDMTYDQLFFINYAQVGAASPLPTCPHTAGSYLNIYMCPVCIFLDILSHFTSIWKIRTGIVSIYLCNSRLGTLPISNLII